MTSTADPTTQHDLRFTPAQDAFRQELREFLAAELPKYGTGTGDLFGRWSQPFSKALAAKGWIGLAWPRAYGGQELGPIERTIYTEEMVSHEAPTMYHLVAERQMGPSLITHGTAEQKEYFLPRIVQADVSFCIGMSEPNAGSDLASVQTRAAHDGDDYVVSGQKIWTSGAHLSDWCWLVVRTDPNVPKHKGISILLVDMRSPGVEVRPLINLAREPGFNELFFDQVRVPRRNLVGEENHGWYILAENLDHERSGVERVAVGAGLFRRITDYARQNLAPGDPLWQEVAELRIGYEVGRMFAYRVAWMQSQGKVPNAEASASKVFGSEWVQKVARFGLKLVHRDGLLATPEQRALRDLIEARYLVTAGLTIAGGTSEIQRNIIGERGLGLPKG